jgi:hypothetical protein
MEEDERKRIEKERERETGNIKRNGETVRKKERKEIKKRDKESERNEIQWKGSVTQRLIGKKREEKER